MSNKKGFALIETMLAIGIMSMGSIGIHHVSKKANEWVNTSTEVSNLNTRFNRLESTSFPVSKLVETSVARLPAVIPNSMITQTTSLSNASSKSPYLSIVSIPGVTSHVLNADEVIFIYNSTKLYQFGIALPPEYQSLPYQLVLTQSDGTVLSNWTGTASTGIMKFSYNYQGPFNDGMFGNRPYESVKLAVLIQENGIWKQIVSKTTKLRK